MLALKYDQGTQRATRQVRQEPTIDSHAGHSRQSPSRATWQRICGHIRASVDPDKLWHALPSPSTNARVAGWGSRLSRSSKFSGALHMPSPENSPDALSHYEDKTNAPSPIHSLHRRFQHRPAGLLSHGSRVNPPTQAQDSHSRAESSQVRAKAKIDASVSV